MTKPIPKPPTGLSKPAANWWGKLISEYRISDSAGLLLLEQGLRSFDRAESARRLLDKEGSVLQDRFGQPRQHPACQVERDSRAALVKTLSVLGIDGAPD